MKDCLITVAKVSSFDDLASLYENPDFDGSCCMNEGMRFVSHDAQMPSGFCESAWQNLYPYVFALANGGGGFFDGWMKNPHSAMISCNDGFRPVSFYIEVVE